VTDPRRDVGRVGEDAAAAYLSRHGYRILHRNLRLGRLGELDIVAMQRSTLVFVEVKAKISGELGGFANITAAKQRKLVALGEYYLQRYRHGQTAVRFDAVEVEYADKRLRDPQIRLLPDAFRS
jgi:putative endonuclease